MQRIVNEYFTFLNRARPHQGIDQQIPIPSRGIGLPEHTHREVIGLPVVNGLHHDY